MISKVPFVCAVSLAFLLTTISFGAEGSNVAESGGEGNLIKIATFSVDASPPIGSPVAYAPARKIEDPLSARGIVLMGSGKPVVLCAVDWIGIGNGGNLIWREKLAEAAGTTADRVSVHTLHQHDAPRCDFRAEEILEAEGLGGLRFDSPFCHDTIQRVMAAIREAMGKAQPVTHIGVGKATVEKVASNRRILGSNGKVAIVRFSASKDPKAKEAPEGTIDPELKLISFWCNDIPLASLTYYACHPQSYYGRGDVTSDFVGIARGRREKALPDIAHIHFNGAGGNIAAGKYNDGSREMRSILADRLEAAMKQAWEATTKTPIDRSMMEWRVEPVKLPPAKHLNRQGLLDQIRTVENKQRLNVATKLAWIERNDGEGVPVDLSALILGKVYLLQMPGELFVEYQLAAQEMRPDATVCMAAYGDYGPGYVGTEVAYSQGGYETSPTASNVSPEVEAVLMKGIERLLK